MQMNYVTVAIVLGLTSVAYAEDAPADFIKDAKLYYRVVACKGSDPLPPTFDQATVDKHCAEMTKRYEGLEKRYVGR
jgi:hypothetical protein